MKVISKKEILKFFREAKTRKELRDKKIELDNLIAVTMEEHKEIMKKQKMEMIKRCGGII